MNALDDVCTGDLLLFSSDAFASFIIKVAIISEYHHVGVAVRIKDGEIVLSGGELCVYDVNSTMRADKLSGKIGEVAIEDYATVKAKGWYTIISYRKIDRKYHTADFITRVKEFIYNHSDHKFNHGRLAMIVAWMRVPFGKNFKSIDEVICSELVTKFYYYCLNLELDEHYIYNPGHYTKAKWISSRGQFIKIFTSSPQILSVRYSAWTSLIVPFLLPIIITLIIIWVIWRAVRR